MGVDVLAKIEELMEEIFQGDDTLDGAGCHYGLDCLYLGEKLFFFRKESHFGRVLLSPVEHGLQVFDSLEQDVDDLFVDQDFPFAAGIKEIFEAVGELVDVGEAEEPGVALEAVHRAEDPVDDLGVAGIFFQGDEVRLDSLE